MEAVSAGKIKRLLINVPPGFAKSLIVNVFWPAWEWATIGAHIRYLSFSYASHLTIRDNEKFRDLIISREYQALYGDRVSLVKLSSEKVQSTKTGWKFASSVGGVGTGERGNRVLLDDAHKVNEAESETVRVGTVMWFRESMQNRLNDLEADVIIVIMQRVHAEDVAGCILENYPDYEHLMIQMEFDDSRICQTSIGWEDPRQEDGELAWPERYSSEALKPFKSIPFLWSAQYQQVPTPRGGGILKYEWWGDWTDEKSWPVFDYILASLDAAYTTKQANDPSAFTIWGVYTDSNGRRRVLLVEAWREWLELHELVQNVAETSKRFKVDKMLIEGKASGVSVAQEIGRLYARENFGIELINPGSEDKEARVHSVVPMFVDGVVVAPQALAYASMVIQECAEFPRGKHDDLCDSTVQALRYLRAIGLAELSWEIQARRTDSLQWKSQKKARPVYVA